MAKICSFCKREVTNGVCCDYCGTPLIFSDDENDNKSNVKNEPKSEGVYKSGDKNVNFSADTEGEKIANREIKSGIEALYEQSRHLRENSDESVFDNRKSDGFSDNNNFSNEKKTASQNGSDDLNNIKINIYNSEYADDMPLPGGETRVISAEDIAMIKRQVEINRENAAHEHAEEIQKIAENIGGNDGFAQNGGNEVFDNKDIVSGDIDKKFNEKSDENLDENIETNTYENTQNEDFGGEAFENGGSQTVRNDEDELKNGENVQTAEENESESEDEEMLSERYMRYMAAAQNTQPMRKEDTKLAKFLKWVLGIMFLLGLVSLFFPSLNPAESSDTISFSIIDAVLLTTTFAGMCFAFFEKKGIRKFIYGIMFSAAFSAVYLIFARPVPPKSIKEICTLSYLAVMFIVSVFGHISSGGTKYEKMQVWFDTFSYLALVVDVFAIAVCIMLYFVMPSDISGAMLPYVAGVLAVSVFALIGIILMMRKKIAGANMYLMSAIALIIVSMLAYNKIIDTIGYYSSVISLMSTIGSGYSKFIALCVAYPIFMYMFLSFLKNKSVEN